MRQLRAGPCGEDGARLPRTDAGSILPAAVPDAIVSAEAIRRGIRDHRRDVGYRPRPAAYLPAAGNQLGGDNPDHVLLSSFARTCERRRSG